MKILFLDIDGVLNSVRSAIAFAGYPMPKRDGDKFDEVAVGLIRAVCVKTNCVICLSSTWRIGIDPTKLGQQLNLPIMDKTPVTSAGIRGKEIDMYLKNAQVDKYAIVDDDSDMLPEQLPYFVKTSHINGLSYENYLELLKNQEGAK